MKPSSNIRGAARRLRKTLAAEATEETALHVAENFLQGPLRSWEEERLPVVSGYWPFGTELDTRPLLTMLAEKGYEVALPVTDAIRPALFFRKWEPGMALVPDAMGMKSPPVSAPLLAPDIIIAAALAFDMNGHRLGYGTGYYDATIRTLRLVRRITVVTIAYAAQEVPTINPGPQDERVDWIVTERYAQRVA